MIESGRTVMPGVSMSTRNAVIPRCRDAVEPVRVSRRQRSENCESDVHTFWPSITQVSPSARARQESEARSEPVPGSENPWHHISRPDSRRGTNSAPSAGGAKSISVGARVSVIEKNPVTTRSRATTSSPTTARNAAGPPRPPTRSGQPHPMKPAAHRRALTRRSWTICCSRVPAPS